MAQSIGEVKAFIGADNESFLKAINESLRASQRFARRTEKTFKRVGQSMQSLGKTMSIAVTAPLVLMAKAADSATMDLARMETRLEFATGSAEKSAEAFSFVSSEVKRLGIELMPSIEGFSNFSAAAKGTSLEGQGARDIFTGMSQAVATLGLTTEQSSGAFKALEQIMSKGKVQAEELRGQLGERIPGAFQIASRAMGKTTMELSKMLEMGEVLSDDFLPKFAAELKKTFQGETPKSIRVMNEFSNSFLFFKKAIADAGITKAMMAIRVTATKLMEAFTALSHQTKETIIQFSALAAAMWPALFIGGKLFTWFGKAVGLLASVASGFIPVLSAVVGLALPLAAAALGVALLLDAFGSLLPSSKSVGEAFVWLQGIWKETANFWGGVIKNILGDTKTLSDGQKTAVEFIAKVWLSLKFAWNAVVVGLQSVIQTITIALDGLLFNMERLASFAKMKGLANSINGVRSGLQKFVIDVEDAKTANLVAMKEITDSWGKAPDILRKDVKSFTAAVSEIGAAALEGIKGFAPEALNRVRALLAEIRRTIREEAHTFPAELWGPFLQEQGPGNIKGIAEFISMQFAPGTEAGIQKFFDETGEQFGPGNLEGMNKFLDLRNEAEFKAILKLNQGTEEALIQNQSIWEIFQKNNLDSLNNWESSAASIFGSLQKGIADNLAATLVAGKSFGKSMVATFKSAGQQLLSLALENALTRIQIAFGETVATGAASAPSPILIPLFAGLAIAGFSAAMSGTMFGSSAGGSGGSAEVSAPAQIQEPAFSVIEPASPTIEDVTDGADDVRSSGKMQPIILNVSGERLLSVLVRETKDGAGDEAGTRFVTTEDLRG